MTIEDGIDQRTKPHQPAAHRLALDLEWLDEVVGGGRTRSRRLAAARRKARAHVR